MKWHEVDGSTAVSEDGITVRRMGRDTLRYATRDRYIDFALESSSSAASVYTRDVACWQPTGEPFTPDDRALVEQHVAAALLTHGVIAVF